MSFFGLDRSILPERFIKPQRFPWAPWRDTRRVLRDLWELPQEWWLYFRAVQRWVLHGPPPRGKPISMAAFQAALKKAYADVEEAVHAPSAGFAAWVPDRTPTIHGRVKEQDDA
jgi:hypothetical protein